MNDSSPFIYNEKQEMDFARTALLVVSIETVDTPGVFLSVL